MSQPVTPPAPPNWRGEKAIVVDASVAFAQATACAKRDHARCGFAGADVGLCDFLGAGSFGPGCGWSWAALRSLARSGIRLVVAALVLQRVAQMIAARRARSLDHDSICASQACLH